MTREEKKKHISKYCADHTCMFDCMCATRFRYLYTTPEGVCEVSPLEITTASDSVIDKVYSLIAEDSDTENQKKDMINPDHYKVHANECIDEIQAMLTPEEFRGFLKGNFLKYRYRSGHKDDPEQEAKKSDWYMNKLMEVEKDGTDL